MNKFPDYVTKEKLETFIQLALDEDIGSGDHSTLAVIPDGISARSVLLIKENCILAGQDFADLVLKHLDPLSHIFWIKKDGQVCKKGEIIAYLEADTRALLSGERLILNTMQRMCGIATLAHRWNSRLLGTKCQLLDTRKTTPGFRMLEKWAVKIGGAENHRYGLFDMIMLKDNHIDYSGGISKAVDLAKKYRESHQLTIKIEVETRNLAEVQEAIIAGADRIMLDNMSLELMAKAVQLIGESAETEASGGITEDVLAQVASTGVDYISAGALTHSAPNIDISLKTYSESKHGKWKGENN